jgi:hypothetical protein
MRKVSDYKLLVFASAEEVEKTVNAYLQQGYELHGPPFGSAASYGQAMIKHEQAEHDVMPSTLKR